MTRMTSLTAGVVAAAMLAVSTPAAVAEPAPAPTPVTQTNPNNPTNQDIYQGSAPFRTVVEFFENVVAFTAGLLSSNFCNDPKNPYACA